MPCIFFLLWPPTFSWTYWTCFPISRASLPQLPPHQPTPSLPPSPHTHLPSPCWSLVDLVWSVILWTPTFSCACAFEAHLTSIEPGCQKAWLGCGGLSWLTGRKPSKASWLWWPFMAYWGLLGHAPHLASAPLVIWGMLPTWLVLP